MFTSLTRPRSRATTLTFVVVLAGMILIQTAWALVVPPFRGVDEHDHAFRAAAVADGEWRPDYHQVERGRGDLITVPDDIVEAAEPICVALSYPGPDDCFPVSQVGDGHVTVGSGAGRYNPAFYWVVGAAAQPFEGSSALYAMRGASALICAAMVALAVCAMRRWSSSIWPHVATLLTLTPVMTYSTAVAAPNGAEMAGALVLWTCLLGLIRLAGTPHRPGLLLTAGVAGAAVLATVRSLGPLWVLLICVTAYGLAGRSVTRSLVRRAPRSVALATLVVALAMTLGAAWTLTAGTNNPAYDGTEVPDSPWPRILLQPVLWLLQSIAAFPARNEVAPTPVYALVLCLFWAIAALAWRASGRRGRVTLTMLVVLSTGVPLVLTLVSYSQIEFAWQGRYGWPYSMGFLLVAGFLLESGRLRLGSTWSRVVVFAVAGVVALATVIGQLFVLENQLRISPLADDPSWIKPSSLLVIALTCFGTLLLAISGLVGVPAQPASDES